MKATCYNSFWASVLYYRHVTAILEAENQQQVGDFEQVYLGIY